jgi:1-deoxy-D-xylulose-5-phosphate reductoisomerase
VSDRLKVAILGSTGSIGTQALSIAAAHPDRIEVVALSAHSNADLLLEQARRFGVADIALADADAAAHASGHSVSAGDPFVIVGGGPDAVVRLATETGAQVVLNALVGAAGLRVTWETVQAGLTLALANKESLVVGGELIMPLVEDGKLIPVDSEHSAIFQCLLGEDARDVELLWLTASGGPFRGRTREELSGITAEQALAHPTWTMGPKITIDSATLMNKGLEVIEAHHLFGIDYDRIRVVVHPQSCVHSMVEYSDGSVKAHLGVTDMRIPIQYAFSHPRRWEAPVTPIDFTTLGSLDFEPADLSVFGCLRTAFQVGKTGGTAPAVMNAANETGVAAFLEGKCGFLGIEEVVQRVLSEHDVQIVESLEQLESVDSWSRSRAKAVLDAL